MIKIVLYLGHVVEGRQVFPYFRRPENVEIYQCIPEHSSVSLTPEIEAEVEKIGSDEPNNTRYIYLIASEDDFQTTLRQDTSWEVVPEGNP